jgi:FtsH-binding integral membrane protein
MNSVFLRLILKLVFGLAIVLAVHLAILYWLKMSLFDNAILLAYGVNVFIAIVIFWMIFKLKENYKEQLGFVFMLGSLLKFLVFFVVFFPLYKADGDIAKVEIATFFVPYLSCLLIEFPDLIKLVQNKA